jgi:hypothetical protein
MPPSPDVSYEQLQVASRRTYGCDWQAGLRKATGINADANDICQTLWSKDIGACYYELLGSGLSGSGGLLNSHALLLPGQAGAWCSTPDAAALDILGDIDIRVEGLGYGGGLIQTIVGKWNTTGNQRSYNFHTAFGIFRLITSPDGIASVEGDLTPAVGFKDAIRVTLDIVNGANKVHEKFSAPDMDSTFTVIDSDTTAGNTSIFNSTAVLGIGAHSGGASDVFTGRITRVQIRSSIGGTIVANPDFRALAPGTTNFVDSAGLTWTVNGTAAIV